MRRAKHICLLLLAMAMVSISPLRAQTKHVDPHFGDTIDRSAEDFIQVSLLIADPGAYLYSVLGHASLRLQCPTFGLDYCFTYESNNAPNRILSFLAGNLKMGLLKMPLNVYCEEYQKHGRGVYEYPLNLPAHVEQNLWRILDQEMLKGFNQPYDYLKRGCSISCMKYVKQAFGDIPIVYDAEFIRQEESIKEIWNKYTEDALWVRFLCYFIGGGRNIEKPLYGEAKLITPAALVQAWQQVTIDGKPLLEETPKVLVIGQSQTQNGWFTPMIAMLLLLLLSLTNIFWHKPYGDWVFLGFQTIIGAFLTYLICFSNLCCTSWNWLLIPFNPLPAIFWYWRKYWSIAYAGILIVWCAAMSAIAFWGHVLVDWSHLLLVLAWTLVVIKQSSTFMHNTRTINEQ